MNIRIEQAPAEVAKQGRLFLKFEPPGGGEVQIKEAARISLDAAGCLVLWDSLGRQDERVALDQVCISQILMVRRAWAAPTSYTA